MRLFPGQIRYPIEFAFLALLIAFLPAFEAPKNIFWVAYAIAWIVNRIKSGNFGGKWRTWDTLILLWIASGDIVAVFAGIKHHEWLGAHDILRYGSIFWMVSRSRHTDAQLRWLLGLIMLSTLLTLGMGLWQYYVSHTKNALQLNSVGHVNHSAIYLAMVLGGVLAWLLAGWRSARLRLPLLLALGLIAGALLVAESRAAAGMAMLLALALCALWMPKTKLPLLAAAGISLALVAGSILLDARIVEKTRYTIQNNVAFSERPEIWNVAMEAWRQYPIFGVGMDNFGQIGQHLQGWLEARGQTFDKQHYVTQAHAHSLYFNTLAERGLFGLSVLLTILAYMAYQLARSRPRAHDPDMRWLMWGGAFSAWFITVGVGTFNTTLHHENAILALLLIGFWLDYEARQGA